MSIYLRNSFLHSKKPPLIMREESGQYLRQFIWTLNKNVESAQKCSKVLKSAQKCSKVRQRHFVNIFLNQWIQLYEKNGDKATLPHYFKLIERFLHLDRIFLIQNALESSAQFPRFRENKFGLVCLARKLHAIDQWFPTEELWYPWVSLKLLRMPSFTELDTILVA